MRWRLILEKLSPELIYIKGSKNIISYPLSRLDKIDDLNNNNNNTYSNNHKVEPTLESPSENFALNNKDVLHPTSFKTILIEIAKEKSKDHFI